LDRSRKDPLTVRGGLDVNILRSVTSDPSSAVLECGGKEMFTRSRTQLAVAGVALGALLAAGASAPVNATPSSFPVDVVVHTDFSSEVAEFEGNIPGCETGTVVNRDASARETPWGGVFVGVKEFTCAGGDGGVDVRLIAQFGEFGATGTWRVIDGWGFLEGVRASGSLAGMPTEIGIDDRYTGSAW
jgi:hypothetical protein